MSRVPGTRAAVCAVALVSSACSTQVDVVATRQEVTPDAGDQYLSVRSVHGCKAGYYAGVVSSIADPDAGLQFPFSATMKFTLVESADTGEFLMLRSDAPLSGTTSTGASFDANITGGDGRREGAVTTHMQDGTYTFAPGTAVPFEGPIDGVYSESTRAFTGTWRALLSGTTTVVARGTWSALWLHK
jgi:hypothetical protein